MKKAKWLIIAAALCTLAAGICLHGCGSSNSASGGGVYFTNS